MELKNYACYLKFLLHRFHDINHVNCVNLFILYNIINIYHKAKISIPEDQFKISELYANKP